MKVRLFLIGICVLLLPANVSAANCPDAGVVVVASVFTTLAVVLIVLGILGFLLWKRRKDISRPEKQKLKNGDSVPGSPGDTFAYSNSAFEKDPEAGEGVGSFEPSRDTIPNNQRLNDPERDLAKKTWSSLPGSNINYVRQRKSSLGSLDRNSYGNGFMLDSSVEVHLTSQDFIGLGFNIAGSMRDGIFVSQVHNRGPAKESGKFKVGDRIMSVTVSFENMVYEDALTILSYASPYPVKVTLQKEPQHPKNRKLSDVRTNLNHPLYRSHSIENLKSTSQDTVFHPRRAASEMRYDKKNSPSTKRISGSGLQSNIIEEANGGTQFINDDVFDDTPTPSKVNVVVHKESPKSNVDDIDSAHPFINLDMNCTNNNYKSDNDKLEEDVVKATSNNQFTDPFENLTEQDKLDVLRLTYADPDAVPFETQDQNFEQAAFNNDQRSAPVKPERKKKNSSSTSTPSHSGDFSNLVAMATVLNETEQQQTLQPPLEAPPPVPQDIFETEETIMPEIKTRNVTVNSDKILLETKAPMNLDHSFMSVDQTITGEESFGDISMNSTDNDRTLVSSSPQFLRSDSPGGESIEEETFTATQLKKESCLPSNAHIFAEKEPIVNDTSLNSDSRVSSNNQSDDSNKLDNEIQHSVPDIDDDFDKDLPSLDMNLNFDTDSVLFKESFPDRNEKENVNGMAYDISVTELDAMGKKAFDEELQKREKLSGKAGIAFEIRDDFTTGETRMVNTNRVHRTASYDVRLSDTVDRIKDLEISSQRPTSFKGEINARDDSEGGSGLGWSGKRLVRSGSFSEIPQDDSVNDWTENQYLEDDTLIEEHIKEDSKSPVMKQLTRATLVTSNSLSNQGKDNFSDDSDMQCLSLSSNDASDVSPMDSGNFDRTNGEDELGSSPDDIPKKLIGYSNEIITPVENHNVTNTNKTITLDIGTEDEENC